MVHISRGSGFDCNSNGRYPFGVGGVIAALHTRGLLRGNGLGGGVGFRRCPKQDIEIIATTGHMILDMKDKNIPL